MRVGPLQKSIIVGLVAATLLATTVAITTLAITVIGSTPLAIGVGVIGTVVTGVVLLYAAFIILNALRHRKMNSYKQTIAGLVSGVVTLANQHEEVSKTTYSTIKIKPKVKLIVDFIDDLQIKQTEKNELLEYFITASRGQRINISDERLLKILPKLNNKKTLGRYLGKKSVKIFCDKVKQFDSLIELKGLVDWTDFFTPDENQKHLINVLKAYQEASFFKAEGYMTVVNTIVNNSILTGKAKQRAVKIQQQCQKKANQVKNKSKSPKTITFET